MGKLALPAIRAITPEPIKLLAYFARLGPPWWWAAASQQALQPTVCPGPGLPLIPRRVAEQMKRNKYGDFAELPPAKGKGNLPAHGLEGQVVVVQAADLVRSRRIISDLATWLQCYASSEGDTSTSEYPRADGLSGRYRKGQQKVQVAIMDCVRPKLSSGGSRKPKPVVGESGAKPVCPMFYGAGSEGWCTTCQGVDHSTADCPFQPRKRPRLAMASIRYQLIPLYCIVIWWCFFYH